MHTGFNNQWMQIKMITWITRQQHGTVIWMLTATLWTLIKAIMTIRWQLVTVRHGAGRVGSGPVHQHVLFITEIKYTGHLGEPQRSPVINDRTWRVPVLTDHRRWHEPTKPTNHINSHGNVNTSSSHNSLGYIQRKDWMHPTQSRRFKWHAPSKEMQGDTVLIFTVCSRTDGHRISYSSSVCLSVTRMALNGLLCADVPLRTYTS